MKNTNILSYTLLTFTCITLIPNNSFAMKRACTTTTQDTFALASDSINSMETEDNEAKQTLSSWPNDIHGKIVTTILSLYLNELENAMDHYDQTRHIWDDRWFNYKQNDKKVFDKITHWIQRTPFIKTINFNATQTKKGETILHHTTEALLDATVRIFENLRYKKYSWRKEYEEEALTLFDLTHYLLRHGANPNLHNKHGWSAFFRCICKLQSPDQNRTKQTYEYNILIDSIINAFVDHGANPNLCCKDFSFFLDILAVRAYSPTVQKIIEKTNIKNLKADYDLVSPAFRAAIHRNQKFLEILVENDVDLTIKNLLGKSALDYIEKYMHINLVDEGILIKKT